MDSQCKVVSSASMKPCKECWVGTGSQHTVLTFSHVHFKHP